jgi:hypothetical protein
LFNFLLLTKNKFAYPRKSYSAAYRYRKHPGIIFWCLSLPKTPGLPLAMLTEQGDTDRATFDWSLPRLIAFTRTGETLNLRHTAVALALMGWYLMAPPQTRTWWVGPPRADNAAPLTRWTNQQSFDNAEKCEAARMVTQVQAGALCVSTEDPRLKAF